MANDPTIGGVTFTYPLAWVDKNTPVRVGSQTRTRDGSLVMIFPKTTDQTYRNAKLLFWWVPKADVETLESYCGTGAEYSADIEGTGASQTIIFPHDAVASWQHFEYGTETVHAHVSGKDTDKYDGELKVIIKET